MSAFVGLLASPFGAGILVMIASSSSFMPTPVFALTSIAPEQSSPMICSISSFTLAGSAAGRSILLMTGMISRLFSSAI